MRKKGVQFGNPETIRAHLREGIVAFKTWVPPCVRKCGDDIAQHTRSVFERNVCKNRWGWRPGWKNSVIIGGKMTFCLWSSQARCPKTTHTHYIYIYISIYLYIHICWRVIRLSTFWPPERLLGWPPWKLLGCPPFWGPFSHYKNRGFWGILGSFLVPNSVFWVSCFCLISHLFFWFSWFFNFPKPLFLKRPFFRKNEKVCVCVKKTL